MKKIISFADESGTSKGPGCYTIGLVAVPLSYLEEFNSRVNHAYNRSGLQGEIKWEKVRKSAGQINLCLDIFRIVLNSPCTFHAIAVKKSCYRKWHSDEHDAFYTTYNYLIKQSSKYHNSPIEVFIDQRSLQYSKQEELMMIIANNMLASLPTSSKITQVKMENSRLYWGLQVADIITGAINTSYMHFLDKSLHFPLAKRIAVVKMARMLGWTRLDFDTYPNSKFNIWHFPKETRGIPKTCEVKIDLTDNNITRDQFEELAIKYKEQQLTKSEAHH
ncbi:DUF3800 domain-containing protein [Rheinheimera fenheensis]|uniref:DUF3800 domain-containing protein n=1 Tax=Rheinheimera fenheensis TaxID=3152295 RepID=UPI003260742C